jgi:Zn-dependent M28 family amino/carboxypeptidase
MDAAQQAPTTQAVLLRDLRALAGDEAEGRGLGQEGLARALEYVVREFQRAGAEPGYVSASSEPAYLQPVPMTRYRYGTGSHATVSGPEGTRRLTHGEELVLLSPGRDVRQVPPATPVFVGHGVSEPDHGWDDYASVDVRGRLIFILESDFSQLPPALQAEYRDPRIGPQRIVQAARAHGVAGMIVIPSPALFARWDMLVASRMEGSFGLAQSHAGSGPEQAGFPVIAFEREVVDEIFGGTGYDPVTRAGNYRSFPLTGVEIGLTLDVTQETLTSHNALGFVPGTDPSLVNELVVVSAHIDHLGVVDGEVFNGANDDASGCALVLELARRIATAPLRRSTFFALFTAEEVGHFGSIHFLEEPPLPGTDVVASLNFEHMGRSENGILGATATSELLALAESVAAAPEHHRLRVRELEVGGRSIQGSDSFSFYLEHIPLIIIGGGGFPEYHLPTDDVELIDFDLLEDGVAVGEALARRLGEGR